MNKATNQIFTLPIVIKTYGEKEATETQEAIDFIIREVGTQGVIKLASKYKTNSIVRTVIKARIGVALPGFIEFGKRVTIPAATQNEAFEVKTAIEYILKELGANGLVKLQSIYASDPTIKAQIKTALT